MKSGLGQMYQCQTAAFKARARNIGHKTDSTPDEPPSHSPPNFEALCAIKREIVSNLPTNCAHCNAEFPSGSIIEDKHGAVIAYCKLKGACGKSHVLFAGVNLSFPIYEKVCVYKLSERKPNGDARLSSAETMALLLRDGATYEQIDINQLQGIIDRNEICELCDKTYSQHPDCNRCDSNGWVEKGRQIIPVPANWPVYNSRTNSWTL